MKRTVGRHTPSRTHKSQARRFGVLVVGAAAVLVLGTGYFTSTQSPVPDARAGGSVAVGQTFERSRAQAQEFMDAYRSIALTESQEAIRIEALSAIPAACCRDSRADTCCCECNLSRSIWGLAKTLIVGGAGAVEVREAAQTWTKTLNPAGYAGDACYTGGCELSMQTDGCGGMDEDNLVF